MGNLVDHGTGWEAEVLTISGRRGQDLVSGGRGWNLVSEAKGKR